MDAEALTRMQHATRRWLGRAETMPAELVEYEFWMMNLKSDKTKEFVVMFNRDALNVLRGGTNPMHLDRATTTRLPSDDLMMFPQICDPQLEEETETEITLRYRIPLMGEVRGGIGTGNIGFWNCNTMGATESVMVIDKERGVPLSEQVFNPGDTMVAEIAYSDYQDVGDGALVPLAIRMDVIQISKRVRHMRYEFHYKIDTGMWLFDEGTAYEVDDESGTLTERALGETRNVIIIEASEKPIVEEPDPTTRPK